MRTVNKKPDFILQMLAISEFLLKKKYTGRSGVDKKSS